MYFKWKINDKGTLFVLILILELFYTKNMLYGADVFVFGIKDCQ